MLFYLLLIMLYGLLWSGCGFGHKQTACMVVLSLTHIALLLLLLCLSSILQSLICFVALVCGVDDAPLNEYLSFVDLNYHLNKKE